MTLQLIHSDKLPANCQWCKVRVQRTSMLVYQAKVYHPSCFAKVQEMAQNLGGKL